MFKVNNKDTGTTPGHYHTKTSPLICRANQWNGFNMSDWRPSGVFIVNFEHISHLVLVFLWITLNMQLPAGWLPIKICLPMLLHANKLTRDTFSPY